MPHPIRSPARNQAISSHRPGDPDVIDPENWHECANPVTYYMLWPGEHKFEVRALDPFHNLDPTPAL